MITTSGRASHHLGKRVRKFFATRDPESLANKHDLSSAIATGLAPKSAPILRIKDHEAKKSCPPNFLRLIIHTATYISYGAAIHGHLDFR